MNKISILEQKWLDRIQRENPQLSKKQRLEWMKICLRSSYKKVKIKEGK